MPASFLTDADRVRLSSFPDTVSETNRVAYFTLSTADKAIVRRWRGDANRLGFALQYCTLRFLGFLPNNLSAAPQPLIAMLAAQLDVSPESLSDYAMRDRSRTDHRAAAIASLGFRQLGSEESEQLEGWLLDRALEHNTPKLLFQLTADHLRREKVIRPGVTVLERLISKARLAAMRETHRRLAPQLTPDVMDALDRLLVVDDEIRGTRLAWLQKEAISSTPKSILRELEKLSFVLDLGAAKFDVSSLNPNRLRYLAQRVRRATNQALQRLPQEQRYPALIAFLVESVALLTDGAVDLFDTAVADWQQRAGRELDQLKRSTAEASNRRVMLFMRLASVVLDASVPDSDVRATIYSEVPAEQLAQAVAETAQLACPLDDSHFAFLAGRYSHVRRVVPAVMVALDLRSNAASADVISAVEVVRQLKSDGGRYLPHDVPRSFVPSRWLQHVIDDEGRVVRRHWELCLVQELRSRLRSGDVWVAGSRRHANPESYLISPEHWPIVRAESCQLLGVPISGAERLQACEAELADRLTKLDDAISVGSVRLEEGRLILGRLASRDLPEEAEGLQRLVAECLPDVHLTDLLIDVDKWCGFSQYLTNPADASPRSKDHEIHLYAAILAQACNFGPKAMATMAHLSYPSLLWTTERYLHEEGLKRATDAIINYQHNLPMAQLWGGGTLSSSDGQGFPLRARNSANGGQRRQLSFGREIKLFTWTSDQFAQFGSRVISSTVRDATYLLDVLLDNVTELDVVEHTSAEPEYLHLIFALFDLLGMQFAPQLRDIGEVRLYRLGGIGGYLHRPELLRGSVDSALILERWDDLLRLAASLQQGHVTASFLISRLLALPRQNILIRALVEYGRVIKTLFVLRYAESEDYRRRISVQMNKGETLHALRRFLFVANERNIQRRPSHEEVVNQMGCLSLVTNASIAWNTKYMGGVQDWLISENLISGPEAMMHLSPTMHGHINPYGEYSFSRAGLIPGQLRPLRKPGIVR